MAISTHDLTLAASICRDLILMRDGRVIAAGPTADVLTPENVRRLYDVEADVHVNRETGHMTVVPVRRLKPSASANAPEER
jgi:iron complex transport system ATP-binding protein